MTTIPNNKRIAIIGGGTNTYISNHLALSAPAYGTTAKILENKFKEHSENKMQVDLYLTKMADHGYKRQSIKASIKFRKESLLTKNHSENNKRIISESIETLEKELLKYPEMDTPEEVEALVDKLITDPDTRVIIFNVAMVDYKPTSLFTLESNSYDAYNPHEITDKFGKYTGRLNTSKLPEVCLELSVQDKIIQKIRKERKDILLVGFKTTCGATKKEQFHKGLKLCKDASANIIFVNDVDKDRIKALDEAIKGLDLFQGPTYGVGTYSPKLITPYISEPKTHCENEKEMLERAVSELQNNGLVTPEESSYWYNTRDEALDALVQMVLDRSHLHFTRSTVVDSETISWDSELIPQTFKTIFDFVRGAGAYKLGPTKSTVGHFGIALGPNEFLTSKRKTDFNKIEEVGLVRVITDDPDNVFGYKHFFRPNFGDDLECYLEFIDNVLTNFKTQDLREDWLGVHGEYWDLLKIFPDLDFLTHEGYRQAKILLEGNTFSNKVIAFGAKPSVGGQSQRSLFDAFPDLNCIVHFHCPLKSESRELFNTTPQFSFECGSLECITSCITGFKKYKVSDTHSIWAGHMDHHGPNIVFNSDINPQLVIDFIGKYWDLNRKTDGLSEENK